MLRNKPVLIPYLLLVAAMAGGLLWYQSARQPELGRVVSTGKMDVGGLDLSPIVAFVIIWFLQYTIRWASYRYEL